MPAAGGFFRAQVLMLWLEIAADFYVYSRNRKSAEISLGRGQHSEGLAYKRCIVGYRWMGGSKEPASSAKAAGLARGQTSSRGRSRHLTRLSHVLMLPTCPPLPLTQHVDTLHQATHQCLGSCDTLQRGRLERGQHLLAAEGVVRQGRNLCRDLVLRAQICQSLHDDPQLLILVRSRTDDCGLAYETYAGAMRRAEL